MFFVQTWYETLLTKISWAFYEFFLWKYILLSPYIIQCWLWLLPDEISGREEEEDSQQDLVREVGQTWPDLALPTAGEAGTDLHWEMFLHSEPHLTFNLNTPNSYKMCFKKDRRIVFICAIWGSAEYQLVKVILSFMSSQN